MDAPIPTRAFGDWQMGYARVAHSELLALSTRHWERHAADRGPRHADGDPATLGLEVLRDFWRRR